MPLFDTHCHLDVDAFDEDRDEALERAEENGVGRILIPATTLDSAAHARAAFARDARVLVAAGVHPESAPSWNDAAAERLEALLEDDAFVAVGECGLDLVHPSLPIEHQEEVFRAQVEVARRHDRPVLVHSRGTLRRVLALLEDAPPGPTVLHAFGGDELPNPRELPDWIYVGLGGIFTFPRSGDVRAWVREFPLERILLETDAPYLAPVPMRGRRNEPAYLRHTAEMLSEVLARPLEEVAEKTTKNAERFLGLSPA